ncbi:helix-turn-helix transcriptional regulator [Marinomonas sp. C2222]|uniref:Helix-turn-helix transcriptional regulator n=1 Tax=Marinomonas sargassi TaxID=2984494 RepID=A0ABT2YPV4_9GAMM|nr:helix-turn-helix transcriptional regulator [Marinomonas sargassi]MCV2401916.1 helix-turn-helix transcriptional regulator [Marinomonas sargassi]
MDFRHTLTNAGVDLVRSSLIAPGVSVSEWSGQNAQTYYEGADENVISFYQHGGQNCSQIDSKGRAIRTGFDDAICVFPKDGLESNWFINGHLQFFHLYIGNDYFAKNLYELNDGYGDRFDFNESLQASDPILSAAMKSIALSDWDDSHIALGLESAANWVLVNLATSHLSESKRRTRKVGCFSLAHQVKIKDYFQDRLGDSVHLSDMANELYLSEFHFLKKFKNTFNETPYACLTRMRMEKAHTLLMKTDKSILDIALECGYNHHTQFSTKFKRYYGFSPRDLRK